MKVNIDSDRPLIDENGEPVEDGRTLIVYASEIEVSGYHVDIVLKNGKELSYDSYGTHFGITEEESENE